MFNNQTNDLIRIYLDWNVITTMQNPDRIKDEKQRGIFSLIRYILERLSSDIVVLYSNAHLADLMKSYQQGERERVFTSLKYLSTITNDTCIAQYWNEDRAKLHERNPTEFFNSMLEDSEDSFLSFDYIKGVMKKNGMGDIFEMFKYQPHNMDIEQISKHMPLFGSIFVRSRTDKSMYATIQDIFDFFQQVNNNPAVYNELRRVFKETLKIDPNIGNFTNTIEQLDQYLPKTMLNKSFTELFEEGNKKQYTKGEGYNKLIGIYMQLDYVGYNSDKLTDKNKYGNLFNDAQHCFYASHCHYFITNDDKTFKKSKAVFQGEKISTMVMKPIEFVDYFISLRS